MMLDGLELKGRMMIVALGITTEGVKIPLGLWEGSTENATVATALLSDLVERGLDPEQGMLFVLDGSKALQESGALGVRRGAGAEMRSSQGEECHAASPRARPAADQGADSAGRGAETDYERALEQLAPTRGRARAHPPRRRRLAEGRAWRRR